jgi:predicted nucleic acid-binding protein
LIFVDTSAFYAILDRDDDAHARARRTWTALLSAETAELLMTSNYVLVESFALTQARLGLDAARELHDAMLPVVSVQWVLKQDHKAAVSALLASDRRRLSLVDCTSFEVMRRLGVRHAFAFDRHFVEHGFQLVGG